MWRKLTATILILIFLFNLGGYRLWFYYLQLHSDTELEAAIDNGVYNDAELLVLKIPISLPYQTNWKEFERADGEINHEGRIYKYVKRKVFNGELVLLCVPNKNKMQIEKAKSDCFKSLHDFANNKKDPGKQKNVFKNLLSEYDEYRYSFKLKYAYETSFEFQFYKPELLIFLPHTSPEQPPDLSRV